MTYLPRGWLQYKAFREFPPKACNFETWSCACSPARQGTAHCVAMAEHTIETPITKLLGIRHPIILAGMNQASGPELAAAVSNAGGCAQSSSVASSRSAPRPSRPSAFPCACKCRDALPVLRGLVPACRQHTPLC